MLSCSFNWDDDKNVHGRNLVNTTSLASFTELFGTFYNFVETLKKEPGVLGKSITNRTWSFGKVHYKQNLEFWGNYTGRCGGMRRFHCSRRCEGMLAVVVVTKSRILSFICT